MSSKFFEMFQVRDESVNFLRCFRLGMRVNFFRCFRLGMRVNFFEMFQVRDERKFF